MATVLAAAMAAPAMPLAAAPVLPKATAWRRVPKAHAHPKVAVAAVPEVVVPAPVAAAMVADTAVATVAVKVDMAAFNPTTPARHPWADRLLRPAQPKAVNPTRCVPA